MTETFQVNPQSQFQPLNRFSFNLFPSHNTLLDDFLRPSRFRFVKSANSFGSGGDVHV